eukprot:IDg22418t1
MSARCARPRSDGEYHIADAHFAHFSWPSKSLARSFACTYGARACADYRALRVGFPSNSVARSSLAKRTVATVRARANKGSRFLGSVCAPSKRADSQAARAAQHRPSASSPDWEHTAAAVALQRETRVRMRRKHSCTPSATFPLSTPIAASRACVRVCARGDVNLKNGDGRQICVGYGLECRAGCAAVHAVTSTYRRIIKRTPSATRPLIARRYARARLPRAAFRCRTATPRPLGQRLRSLPKTALRARARPCTADHARAAHHGQPPFAPCRAATSCLHYRLSPLPPRRRRALPSRAAVPTHAHGHAHRHTRAAVLPHRHGRTHGRTNTHTRAMAPARTATVKPQLATLSSPTRIASGWAHAKWSVLGRLQRRYVVLASCMLEVFEDERSRTPLVSVCVVGASLLPIPQRREMQLRVSGLRVVVQWGTERELRSCVAAFNYANRDISSVYKLVPHRALGNGRASHVVFAFDVASGVHAAVKIVSKTAARPSDRVFAEREVSIRSSVQHPALVQTLDIFESPTELYLVIEFMSGGTLARFMADRRTPLDEDTARIVMARMFCALRHLHSRGIVHRNVKPANLLLDDTEDARWAHTVKLADLSLACRVDDPEAALAVVGTPDYIAPEAATMVSAPDGSRSVAFGVESDMWAAGVTLYNLLSLALPFDAASAPEVLRKVRTASFEFDSHAFNHVSREARSLICALLHPDPRKRLTAATAPYHPWFGVAGAVCTVAPRPAPRRSTRARMLVPLPPSRALVRFRAAVTAITALRRLSGDTTVSSSPRTLGVPGGASFVSGVGGV